MGIQPSCFTHTHTHTHTHTQIRVCLHHGAHEPVNVWMHVLVAQSSLTPGFSVHGILQARIMEWVAIPFSRG